MARYGYGGKTMKFCNAVIILTLTSLGAGRSAIGAEPETVPILVQAIEPSLASNVHHLVTGTCYGQEVVADLAEGGSNLPAKASFSVSGAVHRFGPEADFVHDLLSSSSTSYRLQLYCDNDPNKQIMLFAFGVSWVYDHQKYAATRFWQARVWFSQDGTLVRYSGIQPAD
jgi:hypothetical protein